MPRRRGIGMYMQTLEDPCVYQIRAIPGVPWRGRVICSRFGHWWKITFEGARITQQCWVCRELKEFVDHDPHSETVGEDFL